VEIVGLSRKLRGAGDHHGIPEESGANVLTPAAYVAITMPKRYRRVVVQLGGKDHQTLTKYCDHGESASL